LECDFGSGGVIILKKGIILTIIGLIFVVCLAGCLSGKNRNEITPTPFVTVTITSTPSTVPTQAGDVKEEIPEPKNDIIIYSLDSENFEKIAIPVKIEAGKITLFDFVNKITVALADESFSVVAKNAYFEKTTAIVDFSADGAPGVSSPGFEASLLDCIAQSIIENYDSCTAVIFRIDGGAYKTSNYSFNLDEPYLIK
jgi:hypothetical protein